MKKKELQWHIDRCINILAPDQEERIRMTLSLIYAVQNNEMTDIEFYKIGVEKKCFSSADRYSQSFQTLLKNHGFITEKFTISEIALKYLENKITYKELCLMQLFKKQYKRNESYEIRPLIIILQVLIALEKKDSNEAWVDVYDYMYYISEINSYDDVNSAVIAILDDRKNGNKRQNKYKNDDFDIWFNLFDSLDILELNDKKYYICNKSKKIIDYLLQHHLEAKMIRENEDWFTEYGKFSNGIMEILPKINLTETFALNNLSYNCSDVLEGYLFKGESFDQLDKFFINDGTYKINGSISQIICNSLGLTDRHKGIFSPFDNYRNLIKNNKDYEKLVPLYSLLFPKEKNEVIYLKYDYTKCIQGGKNTIYYGNPGCGKSYKIKHEILKDVEEENIIRTTFFPDYSNSDFIGQIFPTLTSKNNEETLEYKFLPGPFTVALEGALRQPSKKVYLIIEEINRGNAASIFGDLFQLLDRISADEDGNIGESVFSVYNYHLQNYLSSKLLCMIDAIKLPSNLELIATMNTSDQNVYTLDNAFKRRWNFYRISNVFKDEVYPKLFLPGTGIKWEDFVKKINEAILKEGDSFNLEDKQIGCYFVDKELLADAKNIDKEKFILFANKIYEYIWNDIAKMDSGKWFINPNTSERFLSFDLLMDFVEDCSRNISAGLNDTLSVFNSDTVTFIKDEE
ncbi:MAG: AAA family ATPase [Longicatena sp.]